MDEEASANELAIAQSELDASATDAVILSAGEIVSEFTTEPREESLLDVEVTLDDNAEKSAEDA